MNLSEVFLNSFRKFGLLVFIATSSAGCSMQADLIKGLRDGGSKDPAIQTLPFDLSHLDVSRVKPESIENNTTSSGELQLSFSWTDYSGENQVRFVGLPEGALLYCSETEGVSLLQVLDTQNEKLFQLNNWLPRGLGGQDLPEQEFKCWYEVQGNRSQKISFKLSFKEKEIALVSVNASQKTTVLESFVTGTSSDGRYILLYMPNDLLEGDTNGFGDLFIQDLQTKQITLISKSSSGEAGNGESLFGGMSADARYIVFSSDADSLVVNDTNGVTDIFVHDRQTERTTRVSVNSSGVEANGESFGLSSISADGRFVAFSSAADNLVLNDTNGFADIFVHDRETGHTTRVSVSSSGEEAASESWGPIISSDGRYITFSSDANNLVNDDTNGNSDIFVHDRQTGQTTRITDDLGTSFAPSISANGRYVAFTYDVDNLVNDDTNGVSDAFFHDRQTGQTTRISMSSDGTEGNDHVSEWVSMSSDGRYIAFSSEADNLVDGDNNSRSDIFIHDRQTGTTKRVSKDEEVESMPEAFFVSPDGSKVFFNGWTLDGLGKFYSYSVGSDTTIEISPKLSNYSINVANGPSSEASVSRDGRYIAFTSEADNLVGNDTNGSSDIFVQDRQTGITTRVSVGSDGSEFNAWSFNPSISGDGRYVAFVADVNLDDGQPSGVANVFIHDRQLHTTVLVSKNSDGIAGNGASLNPAVSADGRYVVFSSDSDNLTTDDSDSNGSQDIFVHDRQLGLTTRVSISSQGGQGNSQSRSPRISSDGRYIAFISESSNLIPGDTNSVADAFVHDRQTGQTIRVSVGTGGAQFGHSVYDVAMSADGRLITFASAPSIRSGMSVLYSHDRETGETSPVSKNVDGDPAEGYHYSSSISADGRFVSFISDADDLVYGDTGGEADTFIYDRETDSIRRLESCQNARIDLEPTSVLSADGRYVVYTSHGSLLGDPLTSRAKIFVVKNSHFDSTIWNTCRFNEI